MILPRHGRRSPDRRLIDRLGEKLDDLSTLLFEDASAGVLVADRNGLIVRASARLTGLLDRPLEGRPVLAVFCGADRPAVEAMFAASLRGDRVLEPVRARLAMMAEPMVAVALAPVREADGVISGLLIRLADLDTQQRLEARLAHGEKLQAVGQLAGGIAHDFNNLLTAIMGAADSMLQRLVEDAETIGDLRQVRLAAERGAALVRQLLAFGRRQPLQPRIIAVNTAVAEVAGLLRRLLGEKVRLDLAMEEPGRLVRADPTQLDQVLINLAVNARDAMTDGGVLTLRSGHRAFYQPETHGPETIPAGRYVLIEVADTGMGIPSDVVPHVFEPFFTTRRNSGGTGLGLSTVLGIVRQSDGFLTMDSVVGHGTTVRIYLPRYDGEERPPPVQSVPVAEPVTATGRLLLVEDDRPVRFLAERALRRAGWQVLAADSAETALEMVAGLEGEVDLLVSDVVMPGMEGPALVIEIRRIWPDLPVVLVSGYAESALRGDFPSDRVVFLPKPYSLAELLAAVQDVRK